MGWTREVNYYRRYVGDYMRDTADLSMAEHGAYNLLMDYCYATERNLPLEHERLFRICFASTPLEQDAVRYVADRFFPVIDGTRRHKRIEAELAKAKSSIQEMSRAGREGASRRWGKNGVGHEAGDRVGNGVSMHPPTTNHQPPITNHQPPEKKARKRATTLPDGFEISGRVSEWAAGKGFGNLERYHEFFVGRMKASGKAYIDWDQAFMNCIREDWPKFRVNGAESDVAKLIREIEEEDRKRAAH